MRNLKMVVLMSKVCAGGGPPTVLIEPGSFGLFFEHHAPHFCGPKNVILIFVSLWAKYYTNCTVNI